MFLVLVLLEMWFEKPTLERFVFVGSRLPSACCAKGELLGGESSEVDVPGLHYGGMT